MRLLSVGALAGCGDSGERQLPTAGEPLTPALQSKPWIVAVRLASGNPPKVDIVAVGIGGQRETLTGRS